MKKFAILFGALFALLSIGAAATIKRPLTLKEWGGTRYLEWADTATVTSNDSIIFYADTTTARLWYADPNSFLFTNKSATAGFNPWFTGPGGKMPEKYLMRIQVQAVGDAVDIKWLNWFSSTKNGTLAQDSVTTTATHSGTTAPGLITSIAANIFDPGKYVRFGGVMTTATDTAIVRRFTVLPYDD